MNLNHTILQVALKTPLRRLFDYLLPDELCGQAILPGQRVRVPFGKQFKIGIIVSTATKTDIPLNKLKAVSAILDETPLITNDVLNLCQWASAYYQYPLGELFAAALPKPLREGAGADIKQQRRWQLIIPLADALRACTRSKLQTAALHFLSEHPTGALEDRLKIHHIATPVLMALQEKKCVTHSMEIKNSSIRTHPLHAPLTLNVPQTTALQAMLASLGQFNRFLLNGVTGSGKTEVYLQLIAACITRGEQCLVLIPEIGLTPQTIARFQARFDCPIASLHSGLTDSERMDSWLRARQGNAEIIIGTRSAIFTPFKKLGLIIIDEEHDASFKQQDSVRYSARDLALVRAKQNNIPIVLGTATPSLESFYNAKLEKFIQLSLPERAGVANKPTFTVIDCRQAKFEQAISTQLLTEMELQLKAGNQVLLFINRRGFAPVLMCHPCGWIAKCQHCDAHQTIHYSPRSMQCHHCGRAKAIPKQCEKCSSDQLTTLGTGTEKYATLLAEHFKEIPILRIDRDSTRRKGSIESMLETIQKGHPMILIGTQMLAKGHHFPNVTLVGILDADAGFFSPDFRSVERMGQLITQVAGRAGRDSKPGKVFIQTRQPDNPFLQCLIQEGYPRFCEALLGDRKIATLPPFAHLAVIRAENRDKGAATAWLTTLRKQLQPQQSSIQIYGPIPAAMEKRAGVYRAHLLLQSSQRQNLQSGLKELIAFIEKNEKPSQLRWSVDVDPIEVI